MKTQSAGQRENRVRKAMESKESILETRTKNRMLNTIVASVTQLTTEVAWFPQKSKTAAAAPMIGHSSEVVGNELGASDSANVLIGC